MYVCLSQHQPAKAVRKQAASRGSSAFLILATALLLSGLVSAQSSSPTTTPNPSDTQVQVVPNDVPELSQQEDTQSFKVKVNLVEVRVVVRDKNGNAIGSLTKDDFVVLDDKKPQTITKFSVEKNELGKNAPGGTSQPLTATDEVRSHLAEYRRLAFFYDDFHSTAVDLTQAKLASQKIIDSLRPGDLLGIFTFSGQGVQDFTSDKEKLKTALSLLQPRPQSTSGPNDCPAIDYYLADQIINGTDAHAFDAVTTQVIACLFDGNVNDANLRAAQTIARQAIQRELNAGEAQLEMAMRSFNDVIRRVSAFAGQRTIVLFSPGFVVRTEQLSLNDTVDRAIRAGVIVSTLDVKGVYNPPTFGSDITQKAWGSAYWTPDLLQYKNAAYLAQSDPLMQIANSTGGTYIHNTNDLTGSLAKVSAPPEYTYLLAFAPQGLRNDGKFHSLKVDLKQGSGYALQARKGYYAPASNDSDSTTKREVAEAVFGQGEIHELPVRAQTQFFRSSDDKAQVNVVVHVDVKRMQFKKSDGRNLNELVVVAALFDRNANLVNAKSNTVKMHIKDDTLASKLNSGITLRSSFDVPPGSYLVRVVARDEQGKMATQNDVVEIQ